MPKNAREGVDPPARHGSTAEADRVPLPTKVAAGSGEGFINLGINLPQQFLFPIYNIVLGVNPTLLGIALLIPRLWDALLDPLMGSISDNTKSRFGRRRPYMLVGGVMTAVAIAVLCLFPRPETVGGIVGEGTLFGYGVEDVFYAAYLCLLSILFYTCMTLFAVPYGALTMEMTSDYAERTRVMSYRTMFTYLSGLLGGWLYAIAQADLPILRDPVTNEPDPIRGAYAVGLLLALVLLAFSLVPTLLVKEPKRTFLAQEREKIPVLKGLRETVRVPAFLMIVGAYTIGFFGVIMVIGIGQYVCYYHVYEGDQARGSFVQGWAGTISVVSGLVATFLINRLAGKIEKRWLLVLALCCSFVGGVLSWFLYSPDLPTAEFKLGWFTVALHPLAISYALIFPGLAGLLIMSNSMIADLCDLDELKTGQRREGMYWAVFSWIQKTAISFALLAGGVILDVLDFDEKSTQQAPEVIFNMRIAYLVVVCGGVAIAAVITACIPINQKRMERVRAQLAARRVVDGSGS